MTRTPLPVDETEPVTLGDPRVQLPPLGYVTVPEVRAALLNLIRLDGQRSEAMARVGRAKQAEGAAGSADQTAMARALVAGQDTSKLPSAVTRAREEREAAESLRGAYNEAVRLAYSEAQSLAAERSTEWAASCAVTHAEALAAYEQGAAMMRDAVPVLTATGSLAGMLTNTPGALVAPPWKPGAVMSIAADAIDAALPVVRAAAAELAPPAPAEPADEPAATPEQASPSVADGPADGEAVEAAPELADAEQTAEHDDVTV